jgi:hypothetical protein
MLVSITGRHRETLQKKEDLSYGSFRQIQMQAYVWRMLNEQVTKK